MAKIVHLAPDGSYLGLIDRDDDHPGLVEALQRVGDREAERLSSVQEQPSSPAHHPPGETPSQPAQSPENPSESIATLSYDQLRAEAKALGLSSFGAKKADLARMVEAARASG